MTRRRWHILEEADCLTMARRLPVRFDVSAETVLPAGSPVRLARQVRQDMWRRLQGMRGFSPVVKVETKGALCRVTAGGSVEGTFPRAGTEAAIAEVLADPQNRARWSAWAGKGGQADG
ncbi:hypothetical protein NNA36_16995 [Shimia sp. CNT1-13L.2]|uniref:hypothetical protein n=1 Tax=Shimia sp. CNT1-13L.2 TaxID=2959663 RepID=UPI0020CE8AF0|nr:hypothetical protein [Shimia sp. CNT1-13L.2]